MCRMLLGLTVVGVAPAFLAFAPQLAWAQDRKPSPEKVVQRLATPADRVSGVIIKSETLVKDEGDKPAAGQPKPSREKPPTLRLTINIAAVWSDWVRDQASLDVSQSPRNEAAKGAGSIATKGEPRSQDTLVVVDLVPETKVETRFRSPTDESRKGAEDPTAALSDDRDPAAGTPGSRKSSVRSQTTKSRMAKPTRFAASDLKPGLFVEVDLRHTTAKNLATTVAVIRPVGGPETPAETGQ